MRKRRVEPLDIANDSESIDGICDSDNEQTVDPNEKWNEDLISNIVWNEDVDDDHDSSNNDDIEENTPSSSTNTVWKSKKLLRCDTPFTRKFA